MYFVLKLFPLIFSIVTAAYIPQLEDVYEISNETKTIFRDSNTRLVMFGMRHGNRNPTQFLKEVTKEWGFEGNGELTSFGKKQGYAFGRELREFLKGYLSGNFMPSEAQFYSSSANRCQMTLQVTLAGLYPPRSFALWNLALDWSPVPYSIDDPMLRMYRIKCPKSDEAWEPITNDLLPELSAHVERDNVLLDYMSKNTGWKPTLSNAADLADNLLEISYYNGTYPSWIENVNLTGYNSSGELIDAYMKFMESHQIACANYEPCRRMMSGYWLSNILDILETIMNTTKPVPKLIGFSSHTEIVLSIMKEMFVEREDLSTTAGFILEIRDRPEWSIRILEHDPVGIDSHVIQQAQYLLELQKLSHKDGWIPLEEFIQITSQNSFKNWQKECGLRYDEIDYDSSSSPLPISGANSLNVSYLVIVMLTIRYFILHIKL